MALSLVHRKRQSINVKQNLEERKMNKTTLAESHKNAISRAHVGKKHTEETKNKIKASLAATFARRKKKPQATKLTGEMK